MSKQRWTPPSMTPSTATQSPKVKVDEQVVRKMLKVNPALRAGRTTSQVKKALESGESLISKAAPAATEVAATVASDTSTQLRDTIRFFISGKADAYAAARQSIEARRKALDDELGSARAALREQIVSFVKLLDRGTVQANEAALAAAFADQVALLRELGLDLKAIAEAVRKVR